MKKLLFAIAVLACLGLTVNAQDAAKKPEHAQHAEGAKKGEKMELTAEQKAFRKEMIAKYDANKDGKLDKEEKGKFSKEDKEKWDKLFPKPAKGAVPPHTGTNAPAAPAAAPAPAAK